MSRGRRMRWGALTRLSALVFALVPSGAHAAEIKWRAPADCERAEVARAQVEKLVGQELARVEGVTFEVEVTAAEDGAHRVLLRTLAEGSAPREREIAGASCQEVTDAVSVAIALTISEQRRQREANAPPAEGPAPPSEPSQAEGPEPRPRFVLGLGLVIDSGALADPALGPTAQFAFELGLLRLGAFVAVFIPQDIEVAGGPRGGTFDFVLGGLDACGHPAFGDLHLLACAGFELGRIGARGDGVRNERDGDAGWYAPRFELGAGYALAEIARIWLRAGLAIPLARSEFVLDGTDTVHQPASTSYRGLLTIEILL